ncbi:patatin-like phospholipase family protein [Actinacidiphila oryziradicis]|nr:patatin-like phospholipase family protein [Actinacidiphila oryziradicis]
MLQALTDAGIRPDLVVGSSAGALNAVAFAQDPTADGLDHLQRLWTGARRSDVFPVRLGSLVTADGGLDLHARPVQVPRPHRPGVDGTVIEPRGAALQP